MPRKKKTAVVDPEAAPSLEEQLESVTWGAEQGLATEGDSVAARLQGVAALVATCDAAGVEVPLAVRRRVPTTDEVIADYKAKAALANDAKKEQEFLRDHLLAHVDGLYAAGDPDASETLPGAGFALERKLGFHESVSKALLVQLGVDPDLIDRATVSTPYWYWLVKEPKAGA